jgi:hypothetical protein
MAAFLLRLVHLDAQLWYDEIVTVVKTIRIPTSKLITTYTWDNQHTLYSLLAQLSVSIFGEHAWSVRLPSVLLGTGCVPALYLLGRAVVRRREALSAAALLAVSYHAIWFSQNARGYTGLMLGAILATWLFLEGQRRRDWRIGLLYGLTVALTMYMHLTMVFVAGGHALIAGWQLVQAWRKHRALSPFFFMAWSIGLAAVLTVLFYSPMLDDMFSFYFNKSRHQPSDWTSLRWAAAESLRGLITGWGGAAVAATAILGSAGCVRLGRTKPIVLAAFIVPGILGLVTMIVLGRHLWPRFFFFGLGFALIVFVHGVEAVLSAGTRLATLRHRTFQANLLQPRAVAALVLAVMCGASLSMLPRLYRVPKQDLKGALAYVEDVRGSREPLVVMGLATMPCRDFYRADCIEIDAAAELDQILTGGHTVWAIYTFPIHFRSRCPEIADRIANAFEEVKTFPATVGGGEVIVARSLRGAIDPRPVAPSIEAVHRLGAERFGSLDSRHSLASREL